jgi:two-component system, OmpR family, sensor histidine kinase KdpD
VDLPETLPLVPIDATLIGQVLVNLLENAIRHAGREAGLEISAYVDGNFVTAAVADRGPGLKQNELERVFDKFYRDPSSPGSGLGLAICRAIVSAHGGRIWAENRMGGGALFRFTLPLDQPHGR